MTGESCTYQCDQGYLDGTTGSPAGSIMCEATGTFSAPAGRGCVAQPCTDAPAIPHSDRSAGRNRCTGVTGESCTYQCDQGYLDDTTGSPAGSIMCEPTGTFSLAGRGCVAQPCSPMEVPNSNRSAAGNRCTGVTGESCTYQCDDGFRLSSSSDWAPISVSYIQCQPSLEFESADCQVIDECNVQNGGCDDNVLCTRLSPGSFSCGSCGTDQCCEGGPRTPGVPAFHSDRDSRRCSGGSTCTRHWNGPAGCIGSADASHSKAHLQDNSTGARPAASGVIAGTTVIMYISPKDARGQWTAENGVCNATAFKVGEPSSGSQLRAKWDTFSFAEAGGEPRYIASARPTSAGRYQVTAALVRGDLIGSWLDFNVVPARASYTNIVGAGQNTALANQCLLGYCAHQSTAEIAFNVEVFDRYANRRTPPDQDDRDTITMHGSNIIQPDFHVDEDQSGYLLIWTCSANDTQILVEVAGLTDYQKTFRSLAVSTSCATIAPLLVKSPTVDWVEPGGSAVVSGMPKSFQFQVRDSDDAHCKADGTATGCTSMYQLRNMVSLILQQDAANAGARRVQPDPAAGKLETADAACRTHECLTYSFSEKQLQMAGQYTVAVAVQQTCSLLAPSLSWSVQIHPAGLEPNNYAWGRVEESVPTSDFALFGKTVAGRKNVFAVQPRDHYGNVRDQLDTSRFNDSLTLSITGEGISEPIQSSGRWVGDPTFAFVVQPGQPRSGDAPGVLTKTGTYYFDLTLSTHSIFDRHGQRFQVEVVADILAGDHSVRNDLAVDQVLAGDSTTWHFVLMDQFGNVRADNDTCNATMLTPQTNRAVYTSRTMATPGTEGTITRHEWDSAARQYAVTFRTGVSLVDPYYVHVTCQMNPSNFPGNDNRYPKTLPPSSPILGSAGFPVWVRPNELVPAGCTACGPSLAQTEAGRYRRFTITPRDKSGNVRDRGQFNLSDSVIVTIAGPSGPYSDPVCPNSDCWVPSPDYWATSSGDMPGFRASFQPTESGTYQVSVQLGTPNVVPMTYVGQAIRVRIFPAQAHADQSRIAAAPKDYFSNNSLVWGQADACAGQGQCNTPPGVNLSFFVRVYDRFGNERLPDEDVAKHDTVELVSPDPDILRVSQPSRKSTDGGNSAWQGYLVWLLAMGDMLSSTREFSVGLTVANSTSADQCCHDTKTTPAFVYTARVPRPFDLDTFVSLETPPQGSITAGNLAAIVVKIQDDATICMSQCSTTYLQKSYNETHSWTCPENNECQGPAVPSQMECCKPNVPPKCTKYGDRTCRRPGTPKCTSSQKQCTGCYWKGTKLGTCGTCFWPAELAYDSVCNSYSDPQCITWNDPPCSESTFQCTTDCQRDRPCGASDYDRSSRGCVASYDLGNTSIMNAAVTGSAGDANYPYHVPNIHQPSFIPCSTISARAVCIEYSLMATIAGVYSVSVRTPGGPLSLSKPPFGLTVNPGELNLAKTRLVSLSVPTGAARASVIRTLFDESVAGRDNRFAVQPCDQYGNVRDQLSPFDLTASDGQDALKLSISSPQFQVPQDSDGQWDSNIFGFTAQHNLTIAGQYTFEVSLRSGNSPSWQTWGSPSEVTVIPDVLSTHHTTNDVVANPHTHTHAGVEVVWHFVARDKYGNVRTNNDTLNPTLSVEGSAANVSQTPITQMWSPSDGAYKVIFRTDISRPLKYSVKVELQMKSPTYSNQDEAGRASHEVNGSPFCILVDPNILTQASLMTTKTKMHLTSSFDPERHQSSTFVCGNPSRKLEAGETLILEAAGYDEYDNLRWNGNADTITVHVCPGPLCNRPTNPDQPPPSPYQPIASPQCPNPRDIKKNVWCRTFPLNAGAVDRSVRDQFVQHANTTNSSNTWRGNSCPADSYTACESESTHWASSARVFMLVWGVPGDYDLGVTLQMRPDDSLSGTNHFDVFNNQITDTVFAVPGFDLATSSSCRITVIPGPVEPANSAIRGDAYGFQCLDDALCGSPKNTQFVFDVALFDSYGNSRADYQSSDNVVVCMAEPSQAFSGINNWRHSQNVGFEATDDNQRLQVSIFACGQQLLGTHANPCDVDQSDEHLQCPHPSLDGWGRAARFLYSSVQDLGKGNTTVIKQLAENLAEVQSAKLTKSAAAIPFPDLSNNLQVARYPAGAHQTFNITVLDSARPICLQNEQIWRSEFGCVHNFNLDQALLLEVLPQSPPVAACPTCPTCGSAGAACERINLRNRVWTPCYDDECFENKKSDQHAMFHFDYQITVSGSYETGLSYFTAGIQISMGRDNSGVGPWSVIVAPAQLSLSTSSFDYNNTLNALFGYDETEAGRLTALGVVPRDMYFNVRDQSDPRWKDLMGDMLVVEILDSDSRLVDIIASDSGNLENKTLWNEKDGAATDFLCAESENDCLRDKFYIFVASINLSLTGHYSLNVTLMSKDHRVSGPLARNRFENVISVIPAALDTSRTLHAVFSETRALHSRNSADPIDPSANTTFTFVLCDRFGNERVNNDTVHATLKVDSSTEHKSDWWGPVRLTDVGLDRPDVHAVYRPSSGSEGDSLPMRASANMQILIFWSNGNYSVQFSSKLSGRYIVEVSAEHERVAGPGHQEDAVPERTLPGSPFPVFVRPSALDLSVSGSGPQFNVTEAGRLSTFGVMPKDVHGNIRALNVFEFDDLLQVEASSNFSGSAQAEYLTARCSRHVHDDYTSNNTALRVAWDNGTELVEARQNNDYSYNEPHFNVSFDWWRKGDYVLHLSLSDDGMNGLKPFGDFRMQIIAAALDVAKTHFDTFELAQAGRDVTFTFVAKDCYGNVRTNNDTLAVRFEASDDNMWAGVHDVTRQRPIMDAQHGTLYEKETSFPGNEVARHAGMVLQWNGTSEHYSVMFVTTTSGKYTLSVSLGQPGSLVSGTPFNITFYAGDVDPTQTWTSLTNRSRTQAGCSSQDSECTWDCPSDAGASATKCSKVHFQGGADSNEVNCQGCDDYYDVTKRFNMTNESINNCHESGCLMSAGDAYAVGNTVEVQLYDRYGNPRGSYFDDNVTLVANCIPTELPQQPPTGKVCTLEVAVPFSCTRNPTLQKHVCRLLANVSGSYNFSFAISSRPVSHYEPGPAAQPRSLTAIPRVYNTMSVPAYVGPGEASGSHSRLYVESSYTKKPGTKSLGDYSSLNGELKLASRDGEDPGFAGFNAYNDEQAEERFYSGAPLSFKAAIFDIHGNRRYGLDTLVVSFTQVSNVSQSALIFFTELGNAAAIRESVPKAYLREDASTYYGQQQRIETSTTDYTYHFLVGFPARGVWQASAWVCPVGTHNISLCISNPTHLVSTSNATVDVLTSEGRPTYDDIMGLQAAPMQLIICQQNAQHDLLHHPSEPVDVDPLTVRHEDPGLESLLNERCQCKKGWYHSKDSAARCVPCEVGKFQDRVGQHACMNCSAGSYAACATSGDDTTPGTDPRCPYRSPAATQCQLCRPAPFGENNQGTYAWNTGQEKCQDCGYGFLCDKPGMVYPVAKRGFWVSPSNPLTVKNCIPESACKGGYTTDKQTYHPDLTWRTLGADTAPAVAEQYDRANQFSTQLGNLTGLSQVPKSDSGLALQITHTDGTYRTPSSSQCFLSPWRRLPHQHTAQLCPLLHDSQYPSLYDSQHPVAHHDCDNPVDLQSAKDVIDCWEVIGAECAPGYDGDGCALCCKNCPVDKTAETCWKNAATDLKRADCTQIGVVTANYYRANGACTPCPGHSARYNIALAAGFVAGLIFMGPLLLRFGEGLKHAGEMTAPLMTITNFFQTISLFHNLHIHWPESIKQFFRVIENAISLLNFNIEMFHPECELALSFETQWLLQIFSPFAVFAVLGTFLLALQLLSLLATWLVTNERLHSKCTCKWACCGRICCTWTCCGLRQRTRSNRGLNDSEDDYLETELVDSTCEDEQEVQKKMSNKRRCVMALAAVSTAVLCLVFALIGYTCLKLGDFTDLTVRYIDPARLNSYERLLNETGAEMDRWTHHLRHHDTTIDLHYEQHRKEYFLLGGGACIMVSIVGLLYLCAMVFQVWIGSKINSKTRKNQSVSSRPFWEARASFDHRPFLSKTVWILLLYLTVSYIGLVKEAVKVLDCVPNLDGVDRMASRSEIACDVDTTHARRFSRDGDEVTGNVLASVDPHCTSGLTDNKPNGRPCGDGSFPTKPFQPNILWVPEYLEMRMDPPLFGHESDVSLLGNYTHLRALAKLFAFLYGVGVPVVFILIMYFNRRRLKHASYLAKYGILTNKMSERFYWWEAAVTVRKCVLTVTTILISNGYDVDTVSDPKHEQHMKDNEKGALVSLTIVMFAVTLQAWAEPYVDPDVNRAELFSLLGSYFVLLVGLGYRTQEASGGGLIGELYFNKQGKVGPCIPSSGDKDCVRQLFLNNHITPPQPCTADQWDSSRSEWTAPCVAVPDDVGQAVPLLCLVVACFAVVLTLPMIWTVKKLVHHGYARQDTEEDEIVSSNDVIRRQICCCCCKREAYIKLVYAKSAAYCTAIFLVYITSIVVIAEAGCPDDAARPRFYCRTHTQVLDYLNLVVYTLVFFAVSYSLWVFVKKFGTLLDSFGISKSQHLDDELVDMLHKGVVGIANAWAAHPHVSATDLANAQDVLRKIKQFKKATGVQYDKNFSRFFKDEEVYTIYAWLIHAEEDEREMLKWFVDELTEKKSDRDFKLISCPCSSRCDRLCCEELRNWCKKRNRPRSFFEDLDADADLGASEADAWRELYAERDLQQAMTDRERHARFGDVESSRMVELQELGETQRGGRRSSPADSDFVKKNREWREQGQSLSANGGLALTGRKSTRQRSGVSQDHAGAGARKASKKERKEEKQLEKEERARVKAKTKGGQWDVTHTHMFGGAWGKYEKTEPAPEPEPWFDGIHEPPRATSSNLLGSLMQKARSKPPPEVEMMAVDTYRSPFDADVFGDSGANASRAFMSDKPSQKALKKMAKQQEKQEKQIQKAERKAVKAKTKGSNWDVEHTHTAALTTRRSTVGDAKQKLKEKARASAAGRANGATDLFESSFGSVGGDNLDGLTFTSKEEGKKQKQKEKKKKKKKNEDVDDGLF